MSKTKWVLDPTHSELGFKIKHLMITNVSGFFNSFQVQVAGEQMITISVKQKSGYRRI